MPPEGVARCWLIHTWKPMALPAREPCGENQDKIINQLRNQNRALLLLVVRPTPPAQGRS